MASRDNIPTDGHECSQERRLTALEDKQSEHADELSSGRVKFAEIQCNLAQIQATLAEIKVQLAGKTADWLVTARDSVINWVTLAILGGIFWAIVKSGAVAVAK
jgi:acyl-CoA synthetase (NDP forming)